MDIDRIEEGIFLFTMGADVFNESKDKYRLINLKKKNKEKSLTRGEQLQRDIVRQGCADKIARGLDLMIKGLVCLYTVEEKRDDHLIEYNLEILSDRLGKSSEITELADTLSKISDNSYFVHSYIRNCCYVKYSVYSKTLNIMYECGEELQLFGSRHNLYDFDEFHKNYPLNYTNDLK